MKQGFSFHNTIEESGAKLDLSESKANRQEVLVLNFFKSHPNQLFTPYECWEALGLNCPASSIKRAITNLTPDYLTKTDIKKPERYGSDNFTWKYIKKPEQTRLF